MIQLMNFPSIGVRGAANHRHQQPHRHQLQNPFGADTSDDPVVNLTFALEGGAASDFGLDRIGSGRP